MLFIVDQCSCIQATVASRGRLLAEIELNVASWPVALFHIEPLCCADDVAPTRCFRP